MALRASIISRKALEHPRSTIQSIYSFASVAPCLTVGGEQCGMMGGHDNTSLFIVTGDPDLKKHHYHASFESDLEKLGSSHYFVSFPESEQQPEEDWKKVIPYFSHAYDRFTDARRAGRNTLINCSAGANRSITFVLYFLLRDTGLPLHDCLAYLHQLRPEIRPRISNLWGLYQFEKTGRLESLSPRYLDEARSEPEFIKSLEYIQEKCLLPNRTKGQPYSRFFKASPPNQQNASSAVILHPSVTTAPLPGNESIINRITFNWNCNNKTVAKVIIIATLALIFITAIARAAYDSLRSR